MSTSEPLDPKRPWITDPDDLPKGGITLRTMFSPFGDSAQIPFKRAYMILFLLSLPFVLMLLVAALGGGNAIMPLSVLGIISVLLTIAHVRRLNHAGKSLLLAGVVVLPIVLGFGIFGAVAPPHVAEANKIVAQIEADRADPEGAAKRRAEAMKAAREAAKADGAEASSRSGRPNQRGGRGRPGANGGAFNPTSYVMNAASAWPARIALLSWLLVTFWSLMWVARLPRAKTD